MTDQKNNELGRKVWDENVSDFVDSGVKWAPAWKKKNKDPLSPLLLLGFILPF